MGQLITPETVQVPTVVSSSPAVQSFKLIYNAQNQVLALFESTGVVKTSHTLFVSDPTDGSVPGVTSVQGQQQCLDQIKALGLTISFVPNEVAGQVRQGQFQHNQASRQAPLTQHQAPKAVTPPVK